MNTFAPFKSDATSIRLPVGDIGPKRLAFEQKCPTGLRGRRSPNLDVVIEGDHGVVAIEFKCLEPLTRHVAHFSPAYDAEICDGRRSTTWFQEMLRLVDEPRSYRWLDAAQLVKHAFGLAHTFPDRATTLLYIFWEPTNPDLFITFAEHRAEVERFAASVGDAGVRFAALSYPELWHSWQDAHQPGWLPAHLSRLRKRYALAI